MPPIDINRVIACPSYGYMMVHSEEAIKAEHDAVAKRTAELMIARELWDEAHPEFAVEGQLVSEAELVNQNFIDKAREYLDQHRTDVAGTTT